MAIQSFIYGGDTGETPESIKRKREMVARLLAGNSRAPRNIGEGFQAIGNNLAAVIEDYTAGNAEKRGQAQGDALAQGYFGSQTASPGNPVATSSATGSAATAPVSGRGYDNPQAREEYNFAISQGLAPHQASAYVGAKLAESRFDPNARNPGDGRDGSDSIGAFQWNSGRAQALKQFAAQQGKNWNDPAVQRAFAFYELNGSEKFAGDALRNAKTPEEATAAMLHYLRPAGYTRSNPLAAGSAPARIRNTMGIMSAFGETAPMPMAQGRPTAPMPTAQQRVQTAPMPNVGLADMPAPIQGDNRATLLADADYYEKNGNAETARQMRARSERAGQAQMASAGPQGDAGQDPSYLGAEQYGGASAMPTGMGLSYADNEDQTRVMEAQMAAAQGLPYAGNEPSPTNQFDVFSPIPMGAAPNPFVQRAPFEAPPQADVQAPASQEAALVNAPMPPRRPADLAPVQQPIQQPPIEQMTYAQQGAANAMDDRMTAQAFASGGMGQAGPRRSILDGLMSGNNSPFVPAALREPQPGVMPQRQAQAAPEQTAAQATPQSRQANLAALLNSPFVAAETKQLALNQYKEEQARAQAEAERVRTEQQNAAAARAAGLDPALLANPIIGQQAAAAKFREAPEQFRDLTPEERTQRGIDPNDKRPYQVSTKTGKLAGVGGAQTNVSVNTGGSEKQFFDTVKESADAARTASTGLNALREARKAVEDGGFFGAGADARLGFAKLGATLGFEDGRITNTETFRSAIAPQVAAVMKATVGSTQISNEDRKFAEKAAGGSIDLDAKSIKRLLDIMERGSNDIITRHQKLLDAVYPDGPDGKFARERAVFGVQVPAPREPTPAEIEAEMKRRGLR